MNDEKLHDMVFNILYWVTQGYSVDEIVDKVKKYYFSP